MSMMTRPAFAGSFSAPQARMNRPFGLYRRTSEEAARIAPVRHLSSPVSRHAVTHEGVGNCLSGSVRRAGLARSCDGRLLALRRHGRVGLAWLCDLGRRVRCQRAGPLLQQSDGSGPPRRLWPHPHGQVVRDSAHPARSTDAIRVAVRDVKADDQCAQNRSGRASERTHSRPLPRNGRRGIRGRGITARPSRGGNPTTTCGAGTSVACEARARFAPHRRPAGVGRSAGRIRDSR
ncbi:hypothetical protein SANTM175S_03943 [Streptomyces antimycoticus]